MEEEEDKMRDNIIDFLSGATTIIVVGILILGIIGAIVGGVYGCDCAECNARTKNIGFDHRFLFPFGGCQIYINGSWIPLDNWRFLDN